MSKESKPRDRHRQSVEAVRDRDGFCTGCGYYPATQNGEHRADCTLEHPRVDR